MSRTILSKTMMPPLGRLRLNERSIPAVTEKTESSAARIMVSPKLLAT